MLNIKIKIIKNEVVNNKIIIIFKIYLYIYNTVKKGYHVILYFPRMMILANLN